MRSIFITRLIVLGALLALPIAAYAQEATLSGIVTDSTGGVLPGVTITATHEASGNTFLAVTDQSGAYRIPARIGSYKITAELSGFTTMTRTGLELLVGQQAIINVQMSPSTVQESVTVTGEAPLIDVTQSSLGSNVDPRQLSELPVNGRNWIDLTMLAPGSRANAVNETPVTRNSNTAGSFQLNVDGQQMTQLVAFDFGQPRFSRDAIAEFEMISNQFDATQGRSIGMQVNAITKSGTNTLSGTLSGYFRDDNFNAANFIQQRVLPYSDSQVSATFGGPIRKDKIHYFLHYEFEREPQTFSYSSNYPRFNIEETGTRAERKGGAGLDFQVSSQSRLSVCAQTYDNDFPYEPRVSGGATRHPSASETVRRHTNDVFGTLTQVLSNRAVNELMVGYYDMWWFRNGVSASAARIDTPKGPGKGPVAITFTGYTVGQSNLPAVNHPKSYSFRDSFNYAFSKGGRHQLKLGGEYIYDPFTITIAFSAFGNIDAQGGPVPANIQDLLPVWNDVTTWNLAGLSAVPGLVRQYSLGVGDFTAHTPRHDTGAWLQDDWTITSRLTLNLGLRYDLQAGALGERIKLLPFMTGDRSHDTNNIAPRVGFALSLTDRTVIRGGFGKFYGEIPANSWAYINNRAKQVEMQVLNDGRPDFAANPFNGPTPTFEQALARACSTANVAGCFRRNVSGAEGPTMQIPFSYQSSVGVQQQLGQMMSVQADYVYTGSRHEIGSRNINLSYNPATGANYAFTDITRRPYGDWGTVTMNFTESRSNTHALQTAFTRRFSQGWQASGTYTLSGLWDSDLPAYSGFQPVAFQVAPDLGGEYGLAVTDQRHRAVFNGIWEVGYGFQLSGLYFFGSGERYSTNYGGDRRSTGTGGSGRLRPDNTIVPRNNFVGKPIHRVDLRTTRRFSLGGHRGVDGILEVFNLFNHKNYGLYTTQESNAQYGKPSDTTNIAYQARMLQLGFRVTF